MRPSESTRSIDRWSRPSCIKKRNTIGVRYRWKISKSGPGRIQGGLSTGLITKQNSRSIPISNKYTKITEWKIIIEKGFAWIHSVLVFDSRLKLVAVKYFRYLTGSRSGPGGNQWDREWGRKIDFTQGCVHVSVIDWVSEMRLFRDRSAIYTQSLGPRGARGGACRPLPHPKKKDE